MGKLKLKRPLLTVDRNNQLITGVEVRAVERANDYLAYASNLLPQSVTFTLQGKQKIGKITDLRSLAEIDKDQIHLKPFQETIFRIDK